MISSCQPRVTHEKSLVLAKWRWEEGAARSLWSVAAAFRGPAPPTPARIDRASVLTCRHPPGACNPKSQLATKRACLRTMSHGLPRQLMIEEPYEHSKERYSRADDRKGSIGVLYAGAKARHRCAHDKENRPARSSVNMSFVTAHALRIVVGAFALSTVVNKNGFTIVHTHKPEARS